VKACSGAAAGDGIPATDSLVVAVVAAKDSPARLKTDNAVFDCLALARLTCDMSSSIPNWVQKLARSVFAEQAKSLRVLFTFLRFRRKIFAISRFGRQPGWYVSQVFLLVSWVACAVIRKFS
jgi:hypothetical protein